MSRPDTVAEWLELLENRHPVAIDLGLDRVGAVWKRLGRPILAPRVITVAGTNGKGSTVAYIEALLSALGGRVGTYTSPHLLRYNERVRIGGREVTDEELLVAFDRVEAAREGTRLTYFEFGTLAAFVMLAQARLDYAVLEVGLGGRLDAVNLVDADCVVITPVSLDHQEYLGPDRESIGREKAGVIRPGRPVICGEPDPPRSVLDAAGIDAAPVRRLGREFFIEEDAAGLKWRGPEGALALPRPAMTGTHQHGNIATALAAVAMLSPAALRHSLRLARSVGGVRVPGRLQPADFDPRVLVDVGHNPQAAQAIAAALRDAGSVVRYGVLGMLRDKDATGVAAALDPVVGRWHCCTLEGERGRSAQALAGDVARISGLRRVSTFDTVADGLRAAVDGLGESEHILVFGSFLTAAQAVEYPTGQQGSSGLLLLESEHSTRTGGSASDG